MFRKKVFVKKIRRDSNRKYVLHIQTKVLKLAQASSYESFTYYSARSHLINGTAQTLAERAGKKGS